MEIKILASIFFLLLLAAPLSLMRSLIHFCHKLFTTV